MHNQHIPPHYQYTSQPMGQVPLQRADMAMYMGAPIHEERKMPVVSSMTPPKSAPMPVNLATTAVPIQLAKDFLNVVKKGNMAQYNLDVTKIVDDNFRHTCLFYAALIRDLESSYQVMKMFIDRGVLATYTDILNQTVLYYVAREGKLNCVDLLVNLGCNVNHRDQYGQTPLYYAAREGHCELAQKLIMYGADVNNEDANGQTALFYSAREGHKDMCELLIKYGASPNKQDKRRQTPLYWARKSGKPEIMDLLLKYGATPLKEPGVEKEKSGKKPGGKKKQPDKNAPKKYVLTLYKDGMWRPLNAEELREFMETNKDVAQYLNDPELINSLKVPAVPPSIVIYDHWDKAAKRIIAHLWKQQGAWHFHEPVNAEALHIPDYHQIIKNPMDLGTIKQKIATCAYNNCREFIADVELVFNNCITYNGETSDFGVLAKNLKEEFKKQCQMLCLDYYM